MITASYVRIKTKHVNCSDVNFLSLEEVSSSTLALHCWQQQQRSPEQLQVFSDVLLQVEQQAVVRRRHSTLAFRLQTAKQMSCQIKNHRQNELK